MPSSIVVKEGAFGATRSLALAGASVSGKGIVRLIRDADGCYWLRLSDMEVSNPKDLPLRLMTFRAGPDSASRKPKVETIDVYGDPIWLEAGSGGVLIFRCAYHAVYLYNTAVHIGSFAGTIGGWLSTPGAVLNHPLGVLDNPEQLRYVLIVKYRGDAPRTDNSSIYLQAVMHPLERVRARTAGCRCPNFVL
jgi:hypothetical protein